MFPHRPTASLLAALALLLPTGVAAAPYINDKVAMSEANKRAQEAIIEGFREQQIVYLQGFVERDGTNSRWEIRENYAPPTAADSLLNLARRGNFPWSGAARRHGDGPGWMTVPITLQPTASRNARRMTAEQIGQLEALVPGWLSRLRRSDPGLALSQFHRIYSRPLELAPLNSPAGHAQPREAEDLTGTICRNPELAFHPLKWQEGLLTESPGGRYIFDMGADIEVGPDGQMGGDCGGGWTLYDGPTHQCRWGVTPGNYIHPTGSAWAGNEMLVLFGSSGFDHPSNASLGCWVPTIWVFDIAGASYSMWQGPPGPQWVFAGRPD